MRLREMLMCGNGKSPEFLGGGARRRAFAWPLLAVLGATVLPGCTRTYDGTVVPTYQVALNRQYIIPVVTLEPTPLDPPARRLSFPPPPRIEAPPAVVEQPTPPVRRARRTAAAPSQPAAPMAHKCERVSPPSVGRVVMSCG